FGHRFDEIVAAAAAHAEAGDAVVPRWLLHSPGSARVRCWSGRLTSGAGLENFEGGFAVHCIFVNAREYRGLDQLPALLRRDGANLAVRRVDLRPLDNSGSSLLVEKRNQRSRPG